MIKQVEVFIPDGVAEVKGNLDEFDASGYVDGFGKWILAVPVDVVQAIADAWKAYRAAARSGSDDELVYRRKKYETLLDALTEGNDG